MNTATRLAAYGGILALVFGGAFVASDALVPASTVESWTRDVEGHSMGGPSGHSGHEDGAESAPPGPTTAVSGVASAHRGYLLGPVGAPTAVGEPGELSLRVLDPDGDPVTGYVTAHEKQMHLIVVRTDGTRFRHVHPTLGADGTWSIPWEWAAAGTYRVYADFVPDDETVAATDTRTALTLTRTVDVAGRFTPAAPAPSASATVSGFTVAVHGDIVAGSSSTLRFAVSRDGQPVTDLQPYLGAFGHLVALREGDLAYLHAHPEGDEPGAGDLAGPEVTFGVQAPTAGRYLLYLDFQVGGTVYSAPLVVDTTTADLPDADAAPDRTSTDADHDAGTTHGH